MAPKRRKTANDGLGSVVAEYRKSKKGALSGPYYYLYTWTEGKRHKLYLGRQGGPERQASLADKRQERARSRELLRSLTRRDHRAKASRENGASGGRPASPTGRYWHGSDLRARRDTPTQERDRALFKYNKEDIRADLGFAISEDDYVELMRAARGELARRSQAGQAWEDDMEIEVDLSQLRSWVEHGPEQGQQ